MSYFCNSVNAVLCSQCSAICYNGRISVKGNKKAQIFMFVPSHEEDFHCNLKIQIMKFHHFN